MQESISLKYLLGNLLMKLTQKCNLCTKVLRKLKTSSMLEHHHLDIWTRATLTLYGLLLSRKLQELMTLFKRLRKTIRLLKTLMGLKINNHPLLLLKNQ